MKKLGFILSFIIFLGGVLNSQSTESFLADTEKAKGNVLSVATDWGTTPTPTAEPTPSVTQVVINEVEYDPPQEGTDSEWEWFELYNNTSSPITLSGWKITDNHNTDTIPDLTLPANGFAVVAATQSGFTTNYPGFSGLIVYIADGKIGSGLANSADMLILKDKEDNSIDQVNWGTPDPNWSNYNVNLWISGPTVPEGYSLERSPAGKDTDTAADFIDQVNPTPGT